jgi:tetratricopeptide (TPR) repeat protein
MSRGNDQVGIDGSHFWCDAAEFRERVRAGRFADALTLYHGDFLHGFYSDCSHELEEWIDESREALRHEAAEAAARASKEAEHAGDLSAAVAFARRACALAVDDERSTRRLIVLLDLVGDRAAALQAYEQLARRLADGFGAAPAPETLSLIKKVQQRTAAAPESPTVLASAEAPSVRPGATTYRRNVRPIVASVTALMLVSTLALILRPRVANVAPVLGSTPASAITSAHQPSRKAYEAFLKGHYEFARWPRAGASEAALRYYTEAVTIDPQYALAYAEIAELVLGTMSVTPQDVRTGEVAASRALGLDPSLADAHVAMGLARFKAWQWVRAEREFRQAIALKPNLAAAHRFYSQLLRVQRRFDDAIREARTAEALEPLSLAAKVDIGAALFVASRFGDAIETCKSVLELDPTYVFAAYVLGLNYALEGRTAELHAAADRASRLATGSEYELNATFLYAIEAVQRGRRRQADSIAAVMQTRFPGASRLPGLIAIVMLREERPDDAIAWLERGYQHHDFAIANVTSEPWFDPLRKDSRFRLLRTKMGFADS